MGQAALALRGCGDRLETTTIAATLKRHLDDGVTRYSEVSFAAGRGVVANFHRWPRSRGMYGIKPLRKACS